MILDVQGNSIDIFYVLLLYSDKYGFLPELYEILGKDKTFKLLDIFAGMTIKFPSLSEMERIAFEVKVYMKLSRVSEDYRVSITQDLADEYDLTTESIRLIFDKTKRFIEGDLNIEVMNVKRRYKASTR